METTTDITATEQEWAGYALSYGEYHATVEKIAKINDRARKRGFTGGLKVEATREERTTTTVAGIDKTEIVYVTKVTGTAPSYAGWTFLARIDRVGDSFTIATAPGVDHVERGLVRPGACDHCGHDRRRNNTYLVRNDETGQTVNVGSTCIKDFLGWDATVVFFGSGDSSLEPEMGGSHYAPEFSVDTVLAIAYAAIKSHGWVPSSAYDGVHTRSYLDLVLLRARLTEEEKRMVAALRVHAAEATEKVAQIKAYLLSDEFSGTSTYVDNLKVLVAANTVTGRHFGLLASAPQAWIRHNERQAQVKAEAAKTVESDYIAEVGTKKVRVEGTIEAIRYIEGQYGTTVLYTILSKEGNLVKWFASREALGDEEGVEVTIEGTVKKHDEYRGVKSTVLTRCKQI
jgi:hypothetical protein